MNEKLPATILHPEKFKQSQPAGYDGVFDWSWTQGCFGETKITPMDLDGIVERKGNFIIFETKAVGKEIDKGQQITLEALHKRGDCTIMIIWGKLQPEIIEVWYPPSVMKERKQYQGVEKAKEIVSRWFEYANNNPKIK